MDQNKVLDRKIKKMEDRIARNELQITIEKRMGRNPSRYEKRLEEAKKEIEVLKDLKK